MTVKFTRGASPATYIFAPDNPALNIPASPGAWTLCFISTIDGLTTGDNPQYLASTGPFQGTGSFNLVYQTDGASSSIRNKLVLYTNTSSSPVVTTTNSIAPGKTYLWALHQDDTFVRVRRIEITAAASADLLPVLVDGSNTRSLALDPTAGLYIGNRSDLVADRSSDQSIGRVFYMLGTLTDAELQQLAFGKEITELGKTPAWYVRLDNADDLTNRGSSNMTFTKNGAVTTSATQPPFGGASATEPPAQPADTVGATALTAERIYPRVGTSASVAMTGSYTGTTPTTVEYQLCAEDGTTVLKAWATAGATIGGGTWSASPAIPQGGLYRRQVRTKNGTTVLATGAVEAELFGVGAHIARAGSSSSEKPFDSTSGTGFTPADNVRRYLSTTSGFSRFGTVGCAILEANDLAAKLGVPILMISGGEGGTTLAEWNAANNSSFNNFKARVTAAGGRLEAVEIAIGSNDAAAELVVSRAQHAANLRTLISNIRAHVSQPNLPVLLDGFNRRLNDTFDEQADFVRMAENDVGNDANVYHVQALDFVLASDGIHLSASNTNGFRAWAIRNAYVLGEALVSGSYRRGPKITGYSINGNEATVTIAHRSGNDFTPTTGITGFAGLSGSGAVLVPTATVRMDATHIKVTFAEPPVRVTYLAGAAPPVGTQVFDNGVMPLPMSVEAYMAPESVVVEPNPDTTAPTLTGTVATSNITTTSATITIPVASDNVAVAGYEYSINGGAGYSDLGTSRTTNLTGLSPETTYPLRGRAYDAVGNRSAAISGILTTQAEVVTPPPDTTKPTISGNVTAANITANSATISWPAGADNVGVVGNEYSINGGASYINSGTSRSASLAALPAATTYQLRARVYDAAGNRSDPISGSFTTLAAVVTPPASSFVPSISRRIRILPGRNAYETGSFWTASNIGGPVAVKDPESKIDIPFDWTPWLADIGDAKLSAVDFILSPGLVSAAGIPSETGGTVFVSGGAVGQSYSITCRITTATTPARIEDRTVVLQVREQ